MKKYLNHLRHHFLHSNVPRSCTEETKIILPKVSMIFHSITEVYSILSIFVFTEPSIVPGTF